MPRNVRNFWIEGRIDGRESAFEGGPVSKDGGFSLTIYQRNNKNVMTAARLRGYALADGTVRLDIAPACGKDDAKITAGPGGFTIETAR